MVLYRLWFHTSKSIHHLYFIVFLSLFSLFAFTDSTNSSRCLEFVSPVQWKPIQNSQCTLSVTTCDSIKSIRFGVSYLPADEVIPQTLSLGHITRTPYKLIWDIAEIPNQTILGMTLFAEAEYENEGIKIFQQQGIFLTHNNWENSSYSVSYSYDSLKMNPLSVTLVKPLMISKAVVNTTWNEQYIHFHFSVINSHFYSTLPQTVLKNTGITIYLDVFNTKSPFLSEDIKIFTIPIMDEPYQLQKKSVYNPDGTFEIQDSIIPCPFKTTTIMENFKGYSIDFFVPLSIFGTIIPSTVGCNILVSVIDERSMVQRISWVQGKDNFIQSPYHYNDLKLGHKPYLANPYLLWFISFCFGIILGLLGMYFRRISRQYNPLIKFEDSEREKILIQNIITIFEAEIENKNFYINDVSSKLKLSHQKVNSLFKRHYGRSFKKQLLYCRVEIVKERLRSSNASESAIAKSCGFVSVNEMEKEFNSFYGISPYNYRIKNKIT